MVKIENMFTVFDLVLSVDSLPVLARIPTLVWFWLGQEYRLPQGLTCVQLLQFLQSVYNHPKMSLCKFEYCLEPDCPVRTQLPVV